MQNLAPHLVRHRIAHGLDDSVHLELQLTQVRSHVAGIDDGLWAAGGSDAGVRANFGVGVDDSLVALGHDGFQEGHWRDRGRDASTKSIWFSRARRSRMSR